MANNRKQVLSSLFWKGIERFLSQGINLFVQVLMARLLLPQDFGVLAVLLSITNFLSIFVQSGLSISVIRQKDLSQNQISTLFTLSMLTSIIIYVIIFILSGYIQVIFGFDNIKNALRVLSLSLLLYPFIAVYTGILSRNFKFKNLFTKTLIATPISGFIGIILAINGMGIWALITQHLIQLFITAILLGINNEIKLSIKFNFNEVKDIYIFSGKIILTNIITVLSDSLRIFFIGKKYTSEDLGYYNKALTLSGFLVEIVNATMGGVLLPLFSKESISFDSLKNYARIAIRYSSIIMFPILFGIATVSNELIPFVFSNKWSNMVPFFIIFCILRIPGVFINIDKQIYYTLGRSSVILMYESILIILNLVMLVLMINNGPIYIAYGVLIVELIGSILISIISKTIYNYTFFERIKDIYKPLLSSLVMSIIVKLIPDFHSSIPVVILGKVLVGVIVFVFIEFILRDYNFKNLFLLLKNIINKKEKLSND